MIQMNLSIKQTHRFREWTYDYQRGSAGGKEEMRVWDWNVHTSLFKTGNQQGLTV